MTMSDGSAAALDQFVTPRLAAARLRPEDVSLVRRFHTDPDVMEFLGGVRSAEATDAYMERNLAHWDRDGHGIYILRERGTGDLVGLGCLRTLQLDGADEIEIGYMLFKEYWGQGHATEIATACLRLGFDVLSAESLIAITSPDNIGSQRVMERAGMRFERDSTLNGAAIVVYRAVRRARPS